MDTRVGSSFLVHLATERKILNKFRKILDKKVGIKPNRFLNNLLGNPNYKTDYFEMSGIYELICNDCVPGYSLRGI